MKRILTFTLLLCLSLTASAQLVARFEKLFQQPHGYNIQGAAVRDGRLFQFHDGNPCISVYDLSDGSLLQEIPLEKTPSWHNNNVNFSHVYYAKGDVLPLLYAGQERITEHKAVVHRLISMKDGTFRSEIVQTIVFPDPLEMGLYYPNIALDAEKGRLFVTGFSRNSWKDGSKGNGVQILEFPLPDPHDGGIVTLTTKDIRNRFCSDFKIATQGAVIRNGKLYQSFGVPKLGDTRLVCTDLETGKELFVSALGGVPGEPEGLGFDGDRLILVTAEGIVYKSDITIPEP